MFRCSVNVNKILRNAGPTSLFTAAECSGLLYFNAGHYSGSLRAEYF